MDINEYINSGILELYVYGALTEKESEEVSAVLLQHSEVEKEVEEIENALNKLAISTAPYNPEALLAAIKQKLGNTPENGRVIPIEGTRVDRSSRIIMYISLAACLALLVGVFSLLNKNNELRDSIQVVEAEKAAMEGEIVSAREDLNETRELLSVFRDQDITKVPLAGQEVAPEAYVQVFWDRENDRTYIDALGLPEPPEGMVYQVWSLTLNPLTPTSLGLLENFDQDENKVFILNNPNESQAFGITLEPAGGSETPTMEQLYTLGVVKADA